MATASDRLANRVHATIGVIVARIKRQRITIEYPVSFYYATACTIVFLATCLPMGIGPAIAQWFVAPPGLRRLLDLAWWPGALLYVFGHTSCSHLAHNMAIFLVVAPPLESKLGWRTLASKIAITAVAGRARGNTRNQPTTQPRSMRPKRATRCSSCVVVVRW